MKLFDSDLYLEPSTNGTGVVPVPAGLSDSVLGRIAELLCEAELLRRGHEVARYTVDARGVDLLVDGAVTVQVKSTRGVRCRFSAGGNQSFARRRREVDVFACYAHALGVWWVVPSRAITVSGSAIYLSRESGWLGAWSVFSEPPGVDVQDDA